MLWESTLDNRITTELEGVAYTFMVIILFEMMNFLWCSENGADDKGVQLTAVKNKIEGRKRLVRTRRGEKIRLVLFIVRYGIFASFAWYFLNLTWILILIQVESLNGVSLILPTVNFDLINIDLSMTLTITFSFSMGISRIASALFNGVAKFIRSKKHLLKSRKRLMSESKADTKPGSSSSTDAVKGAAEAKVTETITEVADEMHAEDDKSNTRSEVAL
jgi:hypothetical protein